MGAYTVDHNEWMKYAEKEINPIVVEFIKENPEFLFNPEKELTPRNWQHVSQMLNKFTITKIEQAKDTPFILSQITAALLNGNGEFKKFIFKEREA